MSIIKVTYTAPTATGLTASVTRNVNSFPIPPITLNTTTNYSQTYSATFAITSTAPTTVSLATSALNGYTFTRSGDTYTLTGKNNWAYFKRILRTLSIVTDNTTWPNPPLTIDTTITDGVTSLTGTISASALSAATPSTPVLSLLRTGGNENTLTWAASTQNPGPGVAGYYVYRDGDVVTPYATVTSGVTYVDTAAGTGVRTYQIKAFDSSSTVVYSALSNLVTGTVATLTTPTLSTATRVSKTSVDLVWTASTASWGTWANTYDVYRDGVFLATATGLTYVDTAAGVGARTYYVKANDTVVSANSNSIATLASALTAPVASNTRTSKTAASVTWTASTSNWGTWTDTYDVYKDTVFLSTVTGLSYSDTSAGTGTAVYYVKANDTPGTAVASANSNNTTLVAATLTAPVLAAVPRNGKSSAVLTWSASTASWGTWANTYSIYRDGVYIGSSATLTYNDTSAGVGSRTYYVTANDFPTPAIASANSNTVTLAASTLSTPVASINRTGRDTQTVSWSGATANWGVLANNYEVYRDGSLLTTVTSVLSYSDSTAGTGTRTYYIRAVDSPVVSAASNTVNGVAATLNTPTSFALSGLRTKTSATLTWAFGGSNYGLISPGTYEVYQDAVLVSTVTALTATITGLNPLNSYTFTIRAKDGTVFSALAITGTISACTLTTPVIAVGVSRAGNTVLITTTSTANYSSPSVTYDIYRNGSFVGTASGTSYLDTASPFTSYNFNTIAKDSTVTSTASATVSSTLLYRGYLLGADSGSGLQGSDALASWALVSINPAYPDRLNPKTTPIETDSVIFCMPKQATASSYIWASGGDINTLGPGPGPGGSNVAATSVNSFNSVWGGGRSIAWSNSPTSVFLYSTGSSFDLPVTAGSFGLSNITNVQYLNSLWVATGTSTTQYATSTDGITWTTRSFPAANKNLISGAAGLFIATDTTTTTTYTSTDAINWTLRTANLPAINAQISHNGTQWVAISRNASGNAAYSSDGITWTAATLPSSAVYGKAVYGNSKWVVINEGATASTAAAYSTDGITWTAATIPNGLYNNAKPGRPALIFGGGKFAACGAPTGLATMYSIHSTDGITWTLVNAVGSASNFEPIVYG